ncbi:hypothetical protein V1522DRAFT_421162 [Lipomyces starkeyi]
MGVQLTIVCDKFEIYLQFIVRPPPAYNPEFFQERWPLVKFSEHELSGPDIIRPGVGLNGCADDETHSLTYAEELASLELLPAENPDGAEEAMELLRVLHWAPGEQCKFNSNATGYMFLHLE